MKKSTYLCCLALLCLFLTAQAQQNQNIQPLTIGDKVPDVTINNILNHPTGKAQLSDYRGQWLILDFWATWCSPCIAMFPKTDSLQEAFEGQVQFLAVTYEDVGKVNTLFNKLKKLRGLKPLIATSDDQLRALFPHTNLPHYVWVDPEGIVRAITGMEDVNASKLSSMITSGKAEVSFKKESRERFDRKDHLMQLHPKVTGQKFYSSTLTGYVEGAGSFQYTPGDRILAVNLPLWSLYKAAYGDGQQYFGWNLTFLEVKDKSKLISNLQGQALKAWMRNGGAWSYEVMVTAGKSPYEMMRHDLDKHFPQYKASVEKRKIPVLALVRTAGKDMIRSLGGIPRYDIKPYGAMIRNKPLSGLVNMLKIKYLQHLETPVVDQTGFEHPVDLEINVDLANVDELRKALQVYNLDLIQKEAEVDVLVIRDTTL